MESDIYPSHSRRRRSLMQPPDLSELRIVLLGKNSSEISRVGNFILGREAFDSEAPPPSVEQHSERARGTVEGRYITLINTPQLFDPQISEEELNQRVRECAALCSPGPHVLLLILHPDDFTKQDQDRSRQVLNSYSPSSMKYGTVIITNSRRGDSMSGYKELEKNPHLQHLVLECQGRSQNICRLDRHEHLQILERINEIVRQNGGNHLICGTNKQYRMELTQAAPKGHQAHPTEPETAGGDRGGIKKSEKEKLKHKGLLWVRGIHKLTGNKAGISSGQAFSPSQASQKMNLVLCGSNRVLKSSISDLILGQRERRPESSSVCVRREAEVCGRLISLVELPALYNTYLSEEEVMQETLRCVSLCDPGVHAFLFILPEGRLTDEDKGELEKIQRIFGPRLNSYIIFLINTESKLEGVLDDAIKNMNEIYKVPVYVLDTNKMKVLFQTIEQMLVQNNKSCYTVVTYSEAQIETCLKYKSEVEELKKNGPTHSSSSKEDLRIVLLGKTGVGKSASGNTILGKGVFEELLSSQSVTSVCQKESSKIERRWITVIDTPGLFDTNTPNEEITKEIAKCITLAAPGPHVFLLVLALGQRFTQEEKEAVKMIQELFGEESRRYTMVLFTRGDDLRKTNIEKFVSSDRSLQYIIDQCGNRYHVLNNRNPEDRMQVTALLEKIVSTVAENGGSCYTNEMFQDAENNLKQGQERILKERVKEIEREKEELRAKHEAEMEKLKTTLEKERQKQDEERKKSEKEFREREEQIKEEFAEREQLERENYNKRREEDEKRMKDWMADINREREENRKQWENQREKHQRRIEEEEKERKRKEEEWREKQREEKEKFEKEKEEMIQKQRAHQRISLEEYKRMTSEEELSRRDLEEKIKHIEENKRKELLLAQEREWERKKQEEEKRREEQEKEWREQMAIREKEWQLQQCQKQQQYEQERRMEMEKRVLEEKRRKQNEEEERIRKESKANEKIQQMQMQMEKRETEARQREQQLKEELQIKLKTQREIFYRLDEERARAREELEARNLAYIRDTHVREKWILRREIELSARREAEKQYCARLDLKVKEAKEEGYREGEMEGYRKGFAEAETAGFKSKQAKLKQFFVKSGKKQQPFD